MALGRFKPRNAVAVLGAIRTKMEYAYAKPAQEHELTGSVTIVVQSPLPGVIGKAKAIGAKVGDPRTLDTTSTRISSERRDNQGQRPIMANMSTEENAAMAGESPDGSTAFNPLTAPTVHRVGRLLGAPDTRTADQRRADERAAWLADTSVHETGNSDAEGTE